MNRLKGNVSKRLLREDKKRGCIERENLKKTDDI